MRILRTCEEMRAKRRMPASPEPSCAPWPQNTAACAICARLETWMGLPLQVAAPPATAANISSCMGSYTQPRTSSPRRSRAMLTAKMGMPKK